MPTPGMFTDTTHLILYMLQDVIPGTDSAVGFSTAKQKKSTAGRLKMNAFPDRPENRRKGRIGEHSNMNIKDQTRFSSACLLPLQCVEVF